MGDLNIDLQLNSPEGRRAMAQAKELLTAWITEKRWEEGLVDTTEATARVVKDLISDLPRDRLVPDVAPTSPEAIAEAWGNLLDGVVDEVLVRAARLIHAQNSMAVFLANMVVMETSGPDADDAAREAEKLRLLETLYESMDELTGESNS